MSVDQTANVNARAAQLVNDAAKENALPSVADTSLLVSAIADDLIAQSDQAILNDARLTKLETQTRVLSDAVVAITDTADTVAPAVQAVKDEM